VLLLSADKAGERERPREPASSPRRHTGHLLLIRSAGTANNANYERNVFANRQRSSAATVCSALRCDALRHSAPTASALGTSARVRRGATMGWGMIARDAGISAGAALWRGAEIAMRRFMPWRRR
jgi:hypothetical protein